jgi:hypothetical protein
MYFFVLIFQGKNMLTEGLIMYDRVRYVDDPLKIHNSTYLGPRILHPVALGKLSLKFQHNIQCCATVLRAQIHTALRAPLANHPNRIELSCDFCFGVRIERQTVI